MAVRNHSALILAFLGLVLISKVNWEWVVSSPSPSPAECTKIVLSVPKRTEAGFLQKAVVPITKPASPLDGFEAEFYWVTGYAIGDGYTPGEITADGRKVRPGITVACPPELPLGTALYIEGFGVRVCEDRGSAIVGKRLDIAFPTAEAATIFGKQTLAVAVIR